MHKFTSTMKNNENIFIILQLNYIHIKKKLGGTFSILGNGMLDLNFIFGMAWIHLFSLSYE